jgi:hypothetical protein
MCWWVLAGCWWVLRAEAVPSSSGTPHAAWHTACCMGTQGHKMAFFRQNCSCKLLPASAHLGALAAVQELCRSAGAAG